MEREKIRALRQRAEAGDAEAQCKLGTYYSFGKGVAENKAKAVKWYRKAAEQEYVWAQCILGLCYFYGQGVALDFAEAEKWYRKAAEQGSKFANEELEELQNINKE